MRLVLAVLLLAACGRANAGPAWPKMTERETDGGESIEPRAKASAVAAAKTDDDDDVKPAATPDKPAAAKPDAETTKPATAAPAQAPDEVVITTEEIVIEIED